MADARPGARIAGRRRAGPRAHVRDPASEDRVRRRVAVGRVGGAVRRDRCLRPGRAGAARAVREWPSDGVDGLLVGARTAALPATSAAQPFWAADPCGCQRMAAQMLRPRRSAPGARGRSSCGPRSKAGRPLAARSYGPPTAPTASGRRARPSSRRGWSIVVNPMWCSAARAVLSNPTSETSPGTAIPSSSSRSRAPIALRSLAV